MTTQLSGESARELLVAAVPVTDRRLDVHGVSRAVLKGGDGPPIVLLQVEFGAVWMRVIPDLVHLMPGLSAPIPPEGLVQISVPTTLIWGRRDEGVPVHVAKLASARYGWPLHVIEDARDDPALERPQAFLAALRAALAG